MLATLGGSLALLTGLAVMLLPLLALELSRPRDSVWGALILLLGLVLVTSADRLTGSPMLAVLCGGLLIGRLGLEVGQARWRQLTPEEQQRLWSPQRWREAIEQLLDATARLVGILVSSGRGLLSGIGSRRSGGGGKLWVRPEPPQPEAESAAVQEVSDFNEIDSLLQQSTPAGADTDREEAAEPEEGAESADTGEATEPRDGTG